MMKKYKNYNVRVDRNAEIDALTLDECREYIKDLEGFLSDWINKANLLENRVEELLTQNRQEGTVISKELVDSVDSLEIGADDKFTVRRTKAGIALKKI